MSDRDSPIESNEEEESNKRKIDDDEVEQDDEAEEVEPEDEPIKKKKKMDKAEAAALFETEAERSDDDEEDSDEDEDEDLDKNEYEDDGFIVRDDGEEEVSDDGDKEEVIPKKRELTKLVRGGRNRPILDQEDLDLIEEHNRVRDGGSSMPYEEVIAPERIKAKIPKKSSYSNVMSDDEGSGLEDNDEDEDMGEDDDEEGGGGKRGSGRSRGRAGRRGIGGVHQEQLDEMMDIFGDDYEDDDEYDAEEENDGLYDEEGNVARGGGDDPAAVRSQYEHSELVESFCLDSDDALRSLDYPERLIQSTRLLTRNKLSVRPASSEAERTEEAGWIARRLLEERDVSERTNETELAVCVNAVLDLYQVEHMDAPFVWTHRRDYLHSSLTRSALWRIYAYDADWWKFSAKRSSLIAQLEALQGVSLTPKNEASEDTRSELIIADLQSTNDMLIMNLEDATIEYNRQKNLAALSDASAYNRAQETVALSLVESLKEQLKDVAAQLQREKQSMAARDFQRQQRAKYSHEIASKVLHLFPVERYQPLLLSARSEIQLKDIHKYFSIILKACMDSGSPPVDANKEENSNESKSKVPKRIRVVSELDEYYRYAANDALRSFIESFAVSAADLGDGLRHGLELKVEPLAPEVDADTAAAALVEDGSFTSTAAVLRAARVVISAELANEPSVRQGARALFRTNGTVSTVPTPKGTQLINPFHPLFGIHYLRDKPISDFFLNDVCLFAQLIRAEAEGLITMTINPPKDGATVFLHSLKLFPFFMPTLAQSNGDDQQIRQSWDQQRLYIMIDCIDKHLVPALCEEAKRDLIRLSRESIVKACAVNFKAMVSVGPYRSPDITIKDLLLKCPRRPVQYSVACIYIGVDRDPLCMAFLTPDGVVKSQSVLPHKAITQKRERIYNFIKDNRPDIIVLNATGGDASRSMMSMIDRYLVNEVSSALEKEAQDRREEAYARDDYYNDDEFEEPNYSAKVLLVKDDIAQIFAASKRSKAKFPEFEPGVCAAISLARYVQEPLTEFTAIWTCADSTGLFGTEVFFLDLHPLKDLLRGSKGMLINALEQVLIDEVCDVGVDLNFALTHDHAAPLLAFVGGLGLRKADALRRDVSRKLSNVTRRKDLTERKILTKTVYANAISFLRICEDSNAEYLFDPLDDTRIHPECYSQHNFAPKICSDALEVPLSIDYIETISSIMENSKNALLKRVDDQNWLSVWEKIIADGGDRTADTLRGFLSKDAYEDFELKDMLSELELTEYAIELENKNFGKRSKQCEQIKDELRFPWLDTRKPLVQPDPYEVFKLVTKSNDYVLYVGLHVSCQVNEIKEKYATLSVEGGVYRGFVSIRNLSDSRVESMYDVLKVGMKKTGVVVGIDKEKLSLDISFRNDHLKLDESEWMRSRKDNDLMMKWWNESERCKNNFDRYFEEELALTEYSNSIRHKDEEVSKVSVAPVSISRQIFHPLFENWSHKQAETALRERGAGSVVFRPSSKGPDKISISWCFQPQIFRHIDVQEKNKRPGILGLSTELEITVYSETKEIFNDLDDIYAGFIQPLNNYTKQIIDHKSFCKESAGQSDEDALNVVTAKLTLQFKENPSRTPYLFSMSSANGGCFLLSWLTQKGVKSVTLRVTSKGYLFAGSLYPKVSAVLSRFKEQITSNLSQ